MTDQAPAVEVWARMLCAADVHVNDGDHIAWQQLPRLMQNDYRKAARWLLPRLTADQSAAAPSEPADARLRDRIVKAVTDLHEQGGVYALDEPEIGRIADAAMTVADAESSRLRADLAEAEEDIDGWRAVLRRSDNRNDQLRAELERLRADRVAFLREAADICDEAGAVYTSKALNDHAGAAFTLMERFLRKADEAEYVATPCSPGGCEPGGEPCTTHERLMAHGEGDHELCEPDCGTSPSHMADEAQQAGAPLRAELKPWQLLGDVPDEPLPQTERLVGGRRLARDGTQQPETEPCGAWGGCTLARGHNIGQADIPENHSTGKAQQAGERAACGTPSPDGDCTCVLPAGHADFHADKPLEAITPDGSRMVWETPLCGDVNPEGGERCRRSPGHTSWHRDAKQKGTEAVSWLFDPS